LVDGASISSKKLSFPAAEERRGASEAEVHRPDHIVCISRSITHQVFVHLVNCNCKCVFDESNKTPPKSWIE